MRSGWDDARLPVTREMSDGYTAIIYVLYQSAHRVSVSMAQATRPARIQLEVIADEVSTRPVRDLLTEV